MNLNRTDNRLKNFVLLSKFREEDEEMDESPEEKRQRFEEVRNFPFCSD